MRETHKIRNECAKFVTEFVSEYNQNVRSLINAILCARELHASIEKVMRETIRNYNVAYMRIHCTDAHQSDKLVNMSAIV